jgi:hypothetical protein
MDTGSNHKRHKLLFGEFLIKRGVATEEQILKALDEQKKNRLPLGTVAIMEKFLGFKDVYSILNRQMAEPEKNFGEIAVELGLINQEELDRILQLQKEKNPHVGEVLVEQGVLDKERLHEELNMLVRIREGELTERLFRSK